MPRRRLLHRPSTAVGNSGIRSRHPDESSWIRPLWPHDAGGYISSCPKGQVRTARTAPGSDPRNGLGNQVRGSQGQRTRFSGGTRRLRTCSEPKGGRLAGPPTSSFGRFRVRALAPRPAPARPATADRAPVGSRRDPDARIDPCPTTPGAGLARPRRRLLGHLDGRGPRRQPDLRARPVLPARDGRPRGRPARLRRAVQLADLRRRDAARAAVGRVGRQVQPQGRHRPERARRGGRVRRRGAVDGSRGSWP